MNWINGLIVSLLLSISMAFLASAQTEADSLYQELNFDTISEAQYASIQNKYFDKLTNNTVFITQFSAIGLEENTVCDQICETYLTDTISNQTFWLPANYDQGVLGVSFSPYQNQFMVYSSYDGSDFDNYYDYRSEFFVYSISNGSGLGVIKPQLNYYTTQFSLDEIIWIDKNQIALKIYVEDRWGDGSHLKFKYLKTVLK